MKRTITLIFAALITIVTMSFDISSAGGKTGFTTYGCLCHGISATSSVSVTLSFTPSVTNGYVSGTLYNVSATVANTGALIAGIDIAASAGTLVAGTNTQLLSSEITHTGNGNDATSGSVTFDYTWTAPTSGSVTFDYAGVAGNSDNSSSGDFWNKGTQILTQNTSSGITEQSNPNINLSVFPNPISESTTIGYVLSEKSVVSAQLFNLTGQIISTFFINEQQNAGKQTRKLTIDQTISSGNYFLSINVNGKQNFKKIVIE